MKKIISLIIVAIASLALVESTNAQVTPTPSLRLRWDANPASDNVAKYRVYHNLDTTGVIPESLAEWTILGEVDAPTTTFNLGKANSGRNLFVVTAIAYLPSVPGPVGIESDPSGQAILPVPRPPSGTVIEIVVP